MMQARSGYSFLLLATACQFAFATSSFAQNFRDKLLPGLSNHAAHEIQLGEFIGENHGMGLIKAQSGGFGLSADQVFSTKQLLEEVLRSNGLQTVGRFDSLGSGAFGLRDQGGESGRNLHVLTAGHMPFCEPYFVLTLDHGNDQPYYMTGFLPPQNANVTLHDELPDMSESWNASRAALDRLHELNSGNWKESSRKACLWLENGESRKAWLFEMSQGELAYKVVASGQHVLKATPKFFHVDGSATIFPSNSLDAKLQKFTITDLKESGKLANNYFYVLPYGVGEESALVKADNNFSFALSSAEFKQTSLFVNASRVLDWFLDSGYTQFGEERIRIYSQAVIKGEVNNAVYKPSFEGNPPSIYVGDGDGKLLANLITDMDVVSHEFAHHVIFRTIQETDGESAILHEGLADFFTFMRSGDACLGESICPQGSGNCYVPNRCLRTGENNIVLGTSTFPADAHLRGQLISGFMWDLKVKDNIPSGDLVKIALKALDYQGVRSSYRQWILGMLHADKDLFESKNCEVIKARSQARGFKSQTKDINCAAGSLPDPSAGQSAAEKSTNLQAGEVSESEKKKKDNFGCSSVGAPTGQGPYLIFLLALLLPVALTTGRGFLPSRNRS